MYAQIYLIGRVTHEPELKTRTTGEPYLRLNIAVNEGYGEHTHTSYYQCWLDSDETKRAVKAGVKKGSLVAVNGQLSVVEYTRKDGSKDHVAKVGHAHWDYIPIGRKAEETASAAASSAPAAVPMAAPLDSCPVMDLDDADIPF